MYYREIIAAAAAVSHLEITAGAASALDIVDDTQYGTRIQLKLRKFMVENFYRTHAHARV